MKKLSIFMLSMFASLTYANQVESSINSNHKNTQLVQMTDEELSATQGQALYSLTRTDNSSQGLSFYRLGMEAEIAINANIKKLQLGCGGVNGPGNCDIDIDNLSLTGLNPVNGEYAASDAILKNPFIEFAINNPDKASTRETVGLRVGALEALGLLSIGTNSNTSDPSDDTGINSLSGNLTLNLKNTQMTNIRACGGALVLGACLGLWLYGSATVRDTQKTLVFNRDSQIDDLGPLTADATILGLTLNNVHLKNQTLKAIHQIALKSADGTGTKDFYLGLQKQSVTWPTTATSGWNAVPAQRGWWLALPEVTIENAKATQQVSLSGVGAIFGAIFGTQVDVQGIDLAQVPAKNCYGSLKFC
ncbi:hypothetical protein DJ533_14755 [Acinetobacter defluvii]|uniref:Uncharacterized protein n=1 Tax=Acinetobacter defluvii TaxID=1871111 RepID=A0A2S2FHA3_9GAMM|nr:hypothetical protein [Acinetobacter defluvii]AWL29732.1 hypothetical protein DJ533_14755 [Acinetobacter defluvii]